MASYLHIPICEIQDAQFQTMVDEFCQGVGFNIEEIHDKTFSCLLVTAVREERMLIKNCFPRESVLALKVRKLEPHSVIYDICTELGRLNNTILEGFEEKTVLSLIKRCHKALIPKVARKKQLSQKQRDYELVLKRIKLQREQGVL